MKQKQNAKLVQVRYNTESDGKTLCWRLLIDGTEKLANGITLNKPCKTTSDWLEDRQCFKHHISIEDCAVEIDTATMQVTIS